MEPITDMEPITVSQADYESGNYPKGVPIRVAMNVGMTGQSSFNVGNTERKIVIKIKKNDS